MKTNLVVAVMCLSGCLLDAQVSFQLSSTLAAGSDPNSIAAVDVNGDGKVDMICADYYGNSISVLTNNGIGGFVLAGANPVGSLPIIVTAADFNGDGKVDVACVNSGSSSVSVLTNNGSGGFVLSGDYPVGFGPTWVTAADVNGDGKVDLITANWNSNAGNTLTVLTNNGGGGFVLASSPVVGQGPDSVTAADVNGDGKVDLISANRVDNTLTVLTNDGSGGFVLSGTNAVGNGPGFVTAANINGDGKADLIAANWGNASGNTLTVLTNNGSGKFVFCSTLIVGAGALFVAAADVNGDGTLDLICANNTDETLSVLTNNGAGGFVSATTLSMAGSHPNSVAAADVNGDGKVDLLIPTYSLDTISVFTNATPPVNPPPSCDPAPSGLVAWWQGEGNANDIMGVNSGTLMNGAGFANGEVGQAFTFDGTSYVSIPDSSSLDGFTDSITIEAWVKVNQLGVGWDGIVTKGNSSWELRRYSSDSTAAFTTVGLSNQDLGGQKNINDGQWHHVAGVYDGTNKYLYVDGKLDAWVPATGTIAQNSYPVYIGGNAETQGNLPGYFWNGLIDEASIYKRALSSNEIAAIYNAGSYGKCVPQVPPFVITQPTAKTVTVGQAATFSVIAGGTQPLSYQWSVNGTNIINGTNATLPLSNVQASQAGNYSVAIVNAYGSTNSASASLTVISSCVTPPSGLVSWWQAQGNANDIVGSNSGTLMNGAGFANGEVGRAFNFDGTSGYVEVPSSPSLKFTNAFTAEAWVNYNATGNSLLEIVAKGQDAEDAEDWHMDIHNGRLHADVYGSGGWFGRDFTTTLVPGVWYHLAVTYDGLNLRGYVNGTLDGTMVWAGPLRTTDYALRIGAYAPVNGTGSKAFFPGKIDELSLYNRALSSNEIQTIYNAASYGKCVPQVPPFVIAQPTSQTVTVGQTATFIVTAEGTAPLSYQWSVNGTNIVNGTNATLTLNNVQTSQAGNYSVLIANAVGSTNSTSALLTVISSCMPPPSGLVGWWPGEGNANDSIGANNGSLIGGASYASGKVGRAFNVNGNAQYISVPQSPGLNPSNQVTIEFWMKADPTNSMNTYQGLVTSDFYGIEIAPSLFFYLSSDNGGSWAITPGAIVTSGVWHHIAGTYDGTQLCLYVDGQLWSTMPHTGTISPMLANSFLAFGSEDGRTVCNCSGSRYFNGLIDEVSIYNRALSSNEVAAIYSAGSAGKCQPPPPCDPAPSGLVAWWPGEGNAIDSIGANNGTLQGGMSFAGGEVGQAFNCNGTNAYVNVPSSATLLFTNAFSAEAWVNLNNTSGDKTIVAKGQDHDGPIDWHFDVNNGRLHSDVYTVGGWGGGDFTGVTLVTGVWYHVAVTYDGAYLRGYVNGVLDGTIAVGGPLQTTSYPLRIGAYGPSGTVDKQFFSGKLDEISLYNRTLSSGEIAAVYNASSAGKCPSQSPSCNPAPSGLAAWWAGEGNANDSVGSNNGTIVGSIAYTNGEVGRTFSLNGSSGYVAIPDSPLLDSFTNQITVECWIKGNILTANPSWEWIVTKGNSSWRLMGTQGANTLTFTASGTTASDLFGTRNVNDGQWHHVAGVYDGTNMFLYVDGTLDVSQPATSSIFQNSYPVEIGYNTEAPGGDIFNGLIDEVSIYNRGLSSNEIAAIYSAGSYGKCAPQLPPLILTQPANQTVTLGQTATFSVTASGTAPLFYQWSFNGTNIVDATNAILTLTEVQLNQAGSYAATVVNAWGSTNSANALLMVNPPPSCNPAPSGLAAWWAGEGNANDSVGSNNGTIVGSIAYTNGEVGRTFSLNGSSGYVAIPDSPLLDSFTNQITVECWIKGNILTANPSWEWIVTKGNSSWRIMATEGANTVTFTASGVTTGADDLIGTRNVNDGQWHHIAGVYDGTNELLYVDGTLDVSKPGSGMILQNSYPVEIGYNTEAPGGDIFNGLIDEVSIYNRPLSASEIAAIYNAGRAGKCPITNYPPVADASATIPLTVSVNGSNATVVLDGSLSYDLDGDPLQYSWFTDSTNYLTNGVVAVVTLPVGTNFITLTVSDGLASDSQAITVDVITTADAINRLIADTGNASAKQSLLAILRAALASIDRSNPIPAVNQLQAFQNQVSAQLGPIDPASAQALIDEAQSIIDTITGVATTPAKVNITSKANGKPHLKFSAPAGQIYIIEASSDLVNWEKIGVAKDQGDGTFDFDDNQSGQTSTRYYRITVP